MIGDVQNIHAINRLIQFLHRSGGGAPMEICIANGRLTTLEAKHPKRRVPDLVRLGVELGLLSQGDEIRLTEAGVDYAAAVTGDREVSPGQAEVLRRRLLQAPACNPTVQALVTLLRLLRNAQPVHREDLAEGFVVAIGKEQTWPSRVTRRSYTHMALNFLFAMGLVQKSTAGYVLTDVGEAAARLLPGIAHTSLGKSALTPVRRFQLRVRSTRPQVSSDGEHLLLRLRWRANRTTELRGAVQGRRGQALLKLSLLYLYRGCCALCETRERTLLRASHIVPWAQTESFIRLDPENAILLCVLHDNLFDKGFISLSADFQVLISPELDLDRSPSLRPLVTELVFRPPVKHPPAGRYLAQHRSRIWRTPTIP